MILEILFITFNNTNIQFVKKKLTCRFYTNAEALPTTKQAELINKKEFAKVALDKNGETFVMHVVSLNLAPGIHPDREAQIVFLLTKKVKILDKYLDFTDVFLEKKALVIPEHTELNEHAIDQEYGQQPPYGPIHILSLVELKTIKTYIKTPLKTGFI